MYQITPITADALQSRNLVLPDGSNLLIQMKYVPMQYGWFFTNIVNGDFQVQGLRITNNPNLLNPWRNLLSFGLGCFSTSEREPTQQQDFSSGASSLYILSASDVELYAQI